MKETGLITLEYVNTVIRERKKEIHKGDCRRFRKPPVYPDSFPNQA